MKSRRMLFSLLILVLAGCVALSPGERTTLAAAAATYAKVTKEMHRSEVIAAVGAPTAVEGLVLTWRVAVSPHNFESLSVEFTEGDAITKITRVSNRFSRGPAWQTEHRLQYAK